MLQLRTRRREHTKVDIRGRRDVRPIPRERLERTTTNDERRTTNDERRHAVRNSPRGSSFLKPAPPLARQRPRLPTRLTRCLSEDTPVCRSTPSAKEAERASRISRRSIGAYALSPGVAGRLSKKSLGSRRESVLYKKKAEAGTSLEWSRAPCRS